MLEIPATPRGGEGGTELVEPILALCPSLVTRVDLLGLAASKQQARAKWAKNQTSIMVLRIGLQFWWMIAMGVEYNHTKIRQQTQRWQPGTDVSSGGPRFQNPSKMPPKNAPFWPVWVPRMCMEGGICIETNLDCKQTPLITAYSVLHPSTVLNELFLGPKHHKIRIEKPCCILYRIPHPCVG